jgi:hypothetical protein
MNKNFFVIFIVMFLICSYANSQEYDKLIVDSKQWNVLFRSIDTVYENFYTTYQYRIELDSSLSNTELQVLLSTDSLKTWKRLGSIYETDKKVFYRNLKNQQGLIYDFGAVRGDTLTITNTVYNTEINRVRIKSVDSINCLGIQRKRFEVITLDGLRTEFWIEGIGNIKGILDNFVLKAGAISELLCVHIGTNQIYQSVNRNTCYLDNVLSNNDVVRYPSLSLLINKESSQLLFLGADQSLRYQYRIFNSGGKIEQQGLVMPSISIDLPNGIYVIAIYDNRKTIFSQKIQIQNNNCP